ncbi:aminotransferase class V-fold PLP-dependent enzyme [Mesoterricola sediminis]|uniref:Cysteine desulfurase n=1 Tax=Mesoterricola sediminis TaxID=2927980 RepID=A0AA48GVV2_9BACT|nr:aminotransferase class V-fold PLP-dependent enzyme [Mesoterricola sediminis]BDU78759.1 cysteine desulfurase [Mesoterricola sediminis]
MTLPPLNPALLHLDPDHLWLMHCSEGPVPRSVVRAVRAHLHKELWPWECQWREDFLGIPDALRAEAARLVGGEASDITLTPSTSSGLVTVAQALRWSRGDEVVAPLGEFPSNIWPWKALEARGVRFREVPLWEGHRAGEEAWATRPPTAGDRPEDRLIAALGPSTRVLAVSWVRFQDGLVLDLPTLAAACRGRGVHLVVDGIQGAGTAVPDLTGVAAFAAGGHKGLLGPQGMGFLWTDPAFREQLVPTGSWLSVEGGTEFDRPSTDHRRAWLQDGRRMEPGTLSLISCAGALESFRTVNGAGVPEIQAHVRRLQVRLLDALGDVPAWRAESLRLRDLLEAGRVGSFLSLHHGDRGPEGLGEVLALGMRRGIYVSVREGYLRLAFHGWHEVADLARIVDWLAG